MHCTDDCNVLFLSFFLSKGVVNTLVELDCTCLSILRSSVNYREVFGGESSRGGLRSSLHGTGLYLEVNLGADLYLDFPLHSTRFASKVRGVSRSSRFRGDLVSGPRLIDSSLYFTKTLTHSFTCYAYFSSLSI